MVSYPEMDEPIARAERLEARVAELEAALVRICEIGEFEDEPDEDQMLDALTDTRDAARAALFVSGPTDSVSVPHAPPDQVVDRDAKPDNAALTFAAEAAGVLESRFAAPLLLPLLGHESALVREGAVLGLSPHLRAPGVRAAIERLAKEDPSPGVRSTAAGAYDDDDVSEPREETYVHDDGTVQTADEFAAERGLVAHATSEAAAIPPMNRCAITYSGRRCIRLDCHTGGCDFERNAERMIPFVDHPKQVDMSSRDADDLRSNEAKPDVNAEYYKRYDKAEECPTCHDATAKAIFADQHVDNPTVEAEQLRSEVRGLKNALHSAKHENEKLRAIEKAARAIEAETTQVAGAMYEGDKPFTRVSCEAVNVLSAALNAIGPDIDERGNPVPVQRRPIFRARATTEARTDYPTSVIERRRPFVPVLMPTGDTWQVGLDDDGGFRVVGAARATSLEAAEEIMVTSSEARREAEESAFRAGWASSFNAAAAAQYGDPETSDTPRTCDEALLEWQTRPDAPCTAKATSK